MIDLAKEVTRQISEWFAENPVVSTEKDAKTTKLYVDRAKLCLKDLEDERDGKVRPLNDKVNAINAVHKTVRRPLGAVLHEMEEAIDIFIKAEETRRVEIAVESQRRAREAELRARKAEELERDRLQSIRLGEVGLDISLVVEEADEAFSEYEKAQRAAIRAQAETHVKIAGGLSRAMSIKDKEVLEIVDAVAFILEVGVTETMKFPILTAARAFRKKNGRLPNGITATIERHV